MARQLSLFRSCRIAVAAALIGSLLAPSAHATLATSVFPITPASNETFSLESLHTFGDPGQQNIDQSISISGQQIDVSVTILDQHCCGKVFVQVVVSDSAMFNDVGPLPTGIYHVDAQMWKKSQANGLVTLLDSGSFTFQVGGPRTQPIGDYNGDGVVDTADYTVWRDSIGQTGFNLAADGYPDGLIDHRDFNAWVVHFGQSLPASGAAANIPEPSTAASLVIGCVVALVAGRR
jgi:hypothetical protein